MSRWQRLSRQLYPVINKKFPLFYSYDHAFFQFSRPLHVPSIKLPGPLAAEILNTKGCAHGDF